LQRFGTAHASSTGAVTDQIANDAKEPWPNWSRSIEASQRAEETQHCILGYVERVIRIACELKGEYVGLPAAGPGKLIAGRWIPRLGEDHRLGFGSRTRGPC
jgi:hypothetical protein